MDAKEQARILRHEGLGYRTIANRLGIPWPTVRNWVGDIPTDRAQAYRLSVKEIKAGRFPKRKSAVRLRLIQERGCRCEQCRLTEWLAQPIMLEMHRQDANQGYTRENVTLLCPNCHSQTDSWRRSR